MTANPHTSLFLARERSNRAFRRSYPYLPASTVAGAVNTYLHQIGWQGEMERLRPGNLYPGADDDKVWLPAPRNLYICPRCQTINWMSGFTPASAAMDMLCPQCGAVRRPYVGFVACTLAHGRLRPAQPRQQSLPGLNTGMSGRVSLHRSSGIQVSGQLHFVELLRSRRTTFTGTGWLADEAAAPPWQSGSRFRLSMGGLRSRGSGRVTLGLIHQQSQDVNAHSGDLLWVETPLLRLPESLVDASVSAIPAAVISPYARLDVCERWAAKPLASGKGLVSFTDTLVSGSVMQVRGDIPDLGEAMIFYSKRGDGFLLHPLPRTLAASQLRVGRDYSLAELWSLGFGAVRRLELADAA